MGSNKKFLSIKGCTMRVLFSWIGAQDPWIPPGGRPAGRLQRFPDQRPDGWTAGPILNFLANAQPFDVLYLLYTPSILETRAPDVLHREIAGAHPMLTVCLRRVDLDDPRAYDPLYREVRAVCTEAATQYGPDASYNIFLSPGTPQMHAVWVLLCKTVFPATPWQGSDKPGMSKAQEVTIPFDVDAELLEPERNERSRRPLDLGTDGVIGSSESFLKVVAQAQYAAQANDPILILGETGTGKGHIAKLIHDRSPRSGKPFIPVNCGAIPTSLMESELFGYERGAFSGALMTGKKGLFSVAQGGTVFLDEIGELPLDMQVKLLHVLQDNRFTPVGSTRAQSVDVRVVAATNRQLGSLVSEGKFREDLYYRLSVIPLTVPPLRERREDIPVLLDHFVDVANKDRAKIGRPPIRFLPTARRRLYALPWMGNVRQLQNFVRRFSASSQDPTIDRHSVEDALRDDVAAGISSGPRQIVVSLRLDRGFRECVDEVEKTLLKTAREAAGSGPKAAKLLKFNSPQNFYSKWGSLFGDNRNSK